jgi:hypothetical protein
MSYTMFDVSQDYMFCELCQNYVPRDYCEKCQEFTCEYCLAEYGCGDFPLHP